MGGHDNFDPEQSLWCASDSVLPLKTVFNTIFGHMVTIAFDLEVLPIPTHMVILTLDAQIFRNAEHYPNYDFIDKRYLECLNGAVAPKLYFCLYLVMWWPCPLDLK